jgi:hypothetical protein
LRQERVVAIATASDEDQPRLRHVSPQANERLDQGAMVLLRIEPRQRADERRVGRDRPGLAQLLPPARIEPERVEVDAVLDHQPLAARVAVRLVPRAGGLRRIDDGLRNEP